MRQCCAASVIQKGLKPFLLGIALLKVQSCFVVDANTILLGFSTCNSQRGEKSFCYHPCLGMEGTHNFFQFCLHDLRTPWMQRVFLEKMLTLIPLQYAIINLHTFMIIWCVFFFRLIMKVEALLKMP